MKPVSRCDMARHIAQELYQLAALPPPDHWAVRQELRASPASIAEQYALATKIRTERGSHKKIAKPMK